MTEYRKKAGAIDVTDSSGNVFADLGLPHTEKDMLKVYIAHAITRAVQRRNLTQAEAAQIIGADQAKVSALMRGRLKDFGVERLLHYLLLLGIDVDISVSRKHKQRQGRIKFSAA